MKPVLDETHDPNVQSWVESSNVASSDFPIQNLPFGVFRGRDAGATARVGIAIGDRILDLAGIQNEGLLADENVRLAANACASDSLNRADGARSRSAARFARGVCMLFCVRTRLPPSDRLLRAI